MAILITIGAVKEVEATPEELAKRRVEASKVEYVSDKKSRLKKILIAISIVCILIICCKCGNDGNPIENGRLTEVAHEQAVIAIKSQLDDPLSYEGGTWRDMGIWDSNSTSQRYLMMQMFTYKNGFGERARGIAYIYFDINGKPTSIEFQ